MSPRAERPASIVASLPGQLSSVTCSRSQTPASCHSRSRRQQVVPLPHPSSIGNNHQRRCPRGRRGRAHAAGHPWALATPSAAVSRSLPRGHRGQAGHSWRGSVNPSPGAGGGVPACPRPRRRRRGVQRGAEPSAQWLQRLAALPTSWPMHLPWHSVGNFLLQASVSSR
jgi:hypothetical protein